MQIVDLACLKREPIRFDIPLVFPEEDKRSYPWLRERDRFYRLEQELGKGGFSLAFKAIPCDSHGTPHPDGQSVVIKIPNLSSDHLSTATARRLTYIQAQSITEWELIRKKLYGCLHANPIFDMGSIWVSGPPMTQLFVTAQPFLDDAVVLPQWLVDQKLRASILLDEKGQERDWHGIGEWDRWLNVTTMLADGLSRIHMRRIVHGDIWPPNIYVHEGEDPYVVFIDFGESFPVIPSGEPRTQPNHAYRAPERELAESIKTEQVDVYSFGKLALYLAIGIGKEIPRLPGNVLIYGHNRRSWVRDALFEGNEPLVKAHPEVVDLISQCVEVDPVARPTMLELCDQLHDLSTRLLPRAARLEAATDHLHRIAAAAASNQPNKVFTRLIDRKLLEAERLIENCQTEMVELHGTRDELINALVTLCGELSEGDSWTALTTPPMWQHNALGLEGRYATATIQAVRRRASIQRTYAVSVEELGSSWTECFIKALKDSRLPELEEITAAFERALREFNSFTYANEYRPRSKDNLIYHQQRFALVIESLSTIMTRWNLHPLVFADRYETIRTTTGLFVGLAPVGTEKRVQELRHSNPASLMYTAKGDDNEDRWLMVMTDIRGRNENEPIDDKPGAIALGRSNAPQLRRIRVYKSVMGVPKDRIMSIQALMRDSSVNIGPVIEHIHLCVAGMNVPALSEG